MEIIRLEKIEKEYHLENHLYAVLGKDNPTGSIKDITVYQMLLSYQKEGLLKKDTTIIEATSGNTGIALAYYQKEFNYKCLIIMPKSMSKERREKISSLGAELVLIDGGMEECENYAIELQKTINNSFVFSQFDSQYNPLAHYQITGPLIYDKVKNIDYLFAGIGTGGTITGTSRYLKEKNKNIKTIGIEPFESPLLTNGVSGPHLIQGIGANFIPSILDLKVVDLIVNVKGKESIEMARKIREVENLDIGISSGAALLGCLNYIANSSIKNKNLVIIFPDKGDRYSW